MVTGRPSSVVIGALCEDIIMREGSITRALGGTAYYFSSAFTALGGRAACVSKSSGGWMGRILEEEGVLTEGIRPGRSCSYELKYEGGERTLRLARRSSRIEAADVPRSMLAFHGLHLGPIENELGPSIAELTGSFELVSLDVQGLARTFSPASGLVGLRDGFDELTEAILSGVDVVKFSRREAEALLGRATRWESAAGELHGMGVQTVIVTLGPEGAVLYEPGQTHSVPAYPSRPLDWTGAGDSFMAGYVFRRIQDRSSEDSARFGSALAAALIERPRPRSFPGLGDVIAKLASQKA